MDQQAPEGFGQLIREERRRQKRSQEDVAWKAQVDQSDLSRYERGVVRPGRETAQRILRALGLDPSIADRSA